MSNFIWVFVLDWCYDGDTEQQIKAFKNIEDARKLFKKNKAYEIENGIWKACFNANGEFVETPGIACDYFEVGEIGESFSIYEDGNYNNAHYNIYYRTVPLE